MSEESKPMTLTEIAYEGLQAYKQYHPEFKRIFGLNLKPYWDHLVGFDLIKFDDEVVKPGRRESSYEAITKKWGAEAVTLINKLIEAPCASIRRLKETELAKEAERVDKK